MRPMLSAFAVAAALLVSFPALAAPTCENRQGDASKCGIPGAMPVGWTVSDEERALDRPPTPIEPLTLIALICGIGGLFGLIASMPDFDGWREGDWDQEEGDDRRR